MSFASFAYDEQGRDDHQSGLESLSEHDVQQSRNSHVLHRDAELLICQVDEIQ